MIRLGGARLVLLFGGVAIKIPRPDYFKAGLTQNQNEIWWWQKTKDDRLCPIIAAGLKGFIVIMRRAIPMDEDTFTKAFPSPGFLMGFTDNIHRYPDGDLSRTHLPHERKADGFGLINDRPVIIDYGNSSPPSAI